MDIGFYLKWPVGMQSVPGWNVIGDELYANSLCAHLKKRDIISSANIYAPNLLPDKPLDIMVYLNDTSPINEYAEKHVLYLQNIYGNNSLNILQKLRENNYDGYMFISKNLTDIHIKEGYSGLYLPFGVDTDLFYPRDPESEYKFEVCYVGNDIKGEQRTTRYLLPAVNFNLGLFGNWAIPKLPIKEKINSLRKRNKISAYRKNLAKISKGKIPQEKVPVLYSSSKINLNFSHQDCVEWDITTLRTYEVLACKGFLISDIVKSAKEELSDGMVFTDGFDDLTEKISYYLNEKKERDRISEKGYLYVTSNCTMNSRVKQLIEYIKSI